ncbi:hypothetical protein [Maritimibacter fusiformis]|uniref:Uncharacterized protein n=1 Tax=Maritimibacter fusiformis TaxID=2603819 RepID=A0A5D0RPJ4_9RHOB|nr:hypothetical protein [Maritimibacter fusiformis]TYB83472.1 hypothetical protein FVF75_00125 [Maritimibacter fusiformis]
MDYKKSKKRRWGWIIFLVAISLFAVWETYNYFRLGYHTLPELAENEFPLVFSNGLRGIVVDMEDERYAVEPNQARKYIGFVAAEVPGWFKDSWSYCKAPTEEERRDIEQNFDPGPGARLDAVCSFDADGEIIHAGIIYSVPKL